MAPEPGPLIVAAQQVLPDEGCALRVNQPFEGGSRPLPILRGPNDGRVLSAEDADTVPPPRVRHALGYDEFVRFAVRFGTSAKSLFDLWAFAHFIRAHRRRLEASPALMKSAVLFLGNICVANHPECYWTGIGPTLAIESAHGITEDEQGLRLETHRYLGVERTVPAILEADEDRFLEFQDVVDHWKPGALIARPEGAVAPALPSQPCDVS